jgi:[ribosomal protein S5]-alanine N-acetyltransferase
VRIETNRLVLRSPAPSDAEFLVSLYTDPEVLRFLPTGPVWTVELARRSIEARLAMEAQVGYAPLTVLRKDSGQLTGTAGLRLIPNTTEVEILYHYLPSSWGRGFGTEAAIAILGHGLRSVGLVKIIAISLPENVGSWRVMEKAGMRYVGTASYFGIDNLKKYVAERETWKPLQPP